MKIQCACGARYEFDVTPETARGPVCFACSACGQDISEAINGILQAQAGAAGGFPPIAVALPSATRAPMRVTVTPATSAAAAQTPLCPKHGIAFTEQCRVCAKPICPRCMELFGYVCSVPCREAADKAGLKLPVYEGQWALVHARARRKFRQKTIAVTAGIAILAGVWGWYQFVGSKPRVAWSMSFPDTEDDGEVKLVPPNDALVKRGNRLARFNLAAKKQVWAIDLPGGGETHWHVRRQEVWVASRDKLIRLDWKTGATEREVPLPGPVALFFPGDAAIVALVRGELGRQFAVRVSLDNGEARQEEVTLPAVSPRSAVTGVRPSGLAPVAVGGSSGPAPLQAARAIGLLGQRPLPDDDPDAGGEGESFDHSRSEVVGGAGALVQLTVQLLETKTITVQAMKPAPTKSALDGPVNAAATVAIVNETLNEFQRERTGGVEREDASRYQVTLKRLLEPGASGWSGEATGPPTVFPLETVDLLVAGKTVLAFDKGGKKLWDSKLAYGVPELFEADLVPDDTAAPAGPCVQRGNTVFVFDLGVLTAFDATSGNARWRLPSVGINSLCFDDVGALYVNTTDADQESVKFSQQIDIERRVRPLILKVEAATGKILWRARNVGRLAKSSGKFLYAVEWAGGADRARPRGRVMRAHVRIYRLHPETGQTLWEHYQDRQPIALDFHRNTIEILFRKELQTVKFMSF